MKWKKCFLWFFLAFCKICVTISSSLNPAINHNWTRVEKMDPNGILQMEWYLRDKEIVFNVTVNNRGFVAIGFLYQNPKIIGFDMALAWIDDRTAKANILVGFFPVRVSNLHTKHLRNWRYQKISLKRIKWHNEKCVFRTHICVSVLQQFFGSRVLNINSILNKFLSLGVKKVKQKENMQKKNDDFTFWQLHFCFIIEIIMNSFKNDPAIWLISVRKRKRREKKIFGFCG